MLIERQLERKEVFESAVRLGLQAILSSPDFLYLVETGEPTKQNERITLSDYELATRLSYFLWSSMPAQFERALLSKLLIYGTGRALDFSSTEELDQILAGFKGRPMGLRDAVKQVVRSNSFRSR